MLSNTNSAYGNFRFSIPPLETPEAKSMVASGVANKVNLLATPQETTSGFSTKKSAESLPLKTALSVGYK